MPFYGVESKNNIEYEYKGIWVILFNKHKGRECNRKKGECENQNPDGRKTWWDLKHWSPVLYTYVDKMQGICRRK